MEELATLARSAGADVIDQSIQRRGRVDAATLIGSGKVTEAQAQARMHAIDLVIVDNELTPTQQRNLERELETKVIDRTQLILDIFAARARTREGQLQVELAQLNYLLPRLAGHGVEMSRLGGGIGTRGPGETQLETDRRKIHRRIKSIERDLSKFARADRFSGVNASPFRSPPFRWWVTRTRASRRFSTGSQARTCSRISACSQRSTRQCGTSLCRRIAGRCSATRSVHPQPADDAVQAFRSTLEEVTEAELLLHVVDASSPSAAEQTARVYEVLAEIGARDTPQILVLNKMDLMPEGDFDVETAAQRILSDSDHQGPARAIGVSARSGEGLDRLLALVDRTLSLDPVALARFRFPASEGAALHLLHERARVLTTRYDGEVCEVEAEAPESVRRRLKDYLG